MEVFGQVIKPVRFRDSCPYGVPLHTWMVEMINAPGSCMGHVEN